MTGQEKTIEIYRTVAEILALDVTATFKLSYQFDSFTSGDFISGDNDDNVRLELFINKLPVRSISWRKEGRELGSFTIHLIYSCFTENVKTLVRELDIFYPDYSSIVRKAIIDEVLLDLE